MKKGPQKHSTEVIQSAITKFENGARLSSIARELGIEKTTVKYWLDNATKFMPDSPGSPIATRIQSRLTKEAWDIIFMALKEIKRKLPEASMRDLIALLGELFEKQGQFGKTMGNNAVPEKILERSEELQVTVKRFLASKGTGENTPPVESLNVEPVQRIEGQDVSEAQITPTDTKPEGSDGK